MANHQPDDLGRAVAGCALRRERPVRVREDARGRGVREAEPAAYWRAGGVVEGDHHLWYRYCNIIQHVHREESCRGAREGLRVAVRGHTQLETRTRSIEQSRFLRKGTKPRFEKRGTTTPSRARAATSGSTSDVIVSSRVTCSAAASDQLAAASGVPRMGGGGRCWRCRATAGWRWL